MLISKAPDRKQMFLANVNLFVQTVWRKKMPITKRNEKAIDLAHELNYQSAAGIHTYGYCSMPGCKGTARGSAHCQSCVEEKLAKEIGAVMAGRLSRLYTKRGEIQSDIEEIIGEF